MGGRSFQDMTSDLFQPCAGLNVEYLPRGHGAICSVLTPRSLVHILCTVLAILVVASLPVQSPSNNHGQQVQQAAVDIPLCSFAFDRLPAGEAIARCVRKGFNSRQEQLGSCTTKLHCSSACQWRTVQTRERGRLYA